MAERENSDFDPSKHLIKLKGKDYLEISWRLVWFRQVYPQGIIQTSIVELKDDSAIFSAHIETGLGGVAEGYGSETRKDFGDFIEKASTKAIGRALAALGFGTQFAPELEEGERIVDSPVNRGNPQQASPASVKQQQMIVGLAKQLGMIKPDGHHDGPRLDESLRKRVGATLSGLTVQQASDAIEKMQAAVNATKEPQRKPTPEEMDAAIESATPTSLPLDTPDADRFRN
ncbi:MAG: hypothetical protein ACR2OE_14915 [Thermomicrobiales bacterium]